MDPNFSKSNLKNRLSSMEKWKVIVFGLFICERMYPVFPVFCARTGHVGSEVLRAALNRAWILLLDGLDATDLCDLANRCEDVAPDMDDYTDLYASAALDAASATASLLDSWVRNTVSCVVYIASLAIDTIDMLIQQYENIDSRMQEFENTILRHPLMQGELTRQKEDMEFLEACPNLVVDVVPVLVARRKSNNADMHGLMSCSKKKDKE